MSPQIAPGGQWGCRRSAFIPGHVSGVRVAMCIPGHARPGVCVVSNFCTGFTDLEGRVGMSIPGHVVHMARGMRDKFYQAPHAQPPNTRAYTCHYVMTCHLV